MSIASELTALQQDITEARLAITAKGGTVTVGGGSSQLASDINTITTGGGEWQPDPEWWDIETILKNDTRTSAGKAIILYSNADDSTEIKVSYPCSGVATSDGSFYTSTTTHTWDRTKDKIISSDVGKTAPFGTRYLIIYFSLNPINVQNFENFYLGSIYAVFGCDISKSSGSNFNNYKIFHINETLQSFKFLDGYNASFGSNLTYFCSGCSSLQKLPDNLDVSSGTNFESFCGSCYSLQKLPDDLDVSSGTSFMGFCGNCYSLQKLPDNLDVSSGTSFYGFCKYCYSLQKLPDTLDVSSGTIFYEFCNRCFSLQRLPDVLDVSSGTNFSDFLYGCHALIKANINLPSGSSITSLRNSKFLSIESLRYIAQNAPNVSGLTLTIGATNITRAGGASGTIIQTLTGKGWTVN